MTRAFSEKHTETCRGAHFAPMAQCRGHYPNVLRSWESNKRIQVAQQALFESPRSLFGCPGAAVGKERHRAQEW